MADVARVLADNRSAFLSFLQRRVGSDLAEEILQESFAKSLDRLEELRDEDAAIAWFYRTLRNAIVDHFRRKGSANRALAELAAEVETSEEPIETIKAEACRCILRLSGALKPEYARALQRIEVDGLSVKDFAAEEGISESNAGVRVFRARDALRRQLRASCGTCATHNCTSCTCESS